MGKRNGKKQKKQTHPNAQGQQQHQNPNGQSQQKQPNQKAPQQQQNLQQNQQQNQQLPKDKPQQNPYDKNNQEVLEKIQRVVSSENPLDKYKGLEEIGKGGNGTVYRARQVDTQNEVAIKIMKLYLKSVSTGHCYIPRYDVEIENMKLTCKENGSIVKYVDSFLVGEEEEEKEVWLITEFIHGATLFDISPTQKTSVIAAIVYKILQDLECIHSKGLVHRDIKRDNILVSKRGEVKLIDFGFCTTVEADMHVIGTPIYMAPEQFGSSYTSKVDIWALGITVLAVVLRDHDGFIDRYGRPGIPKKQLGPELSDFVEQCLVVNPNQRPTATKLLNHKFIQKYKKNATSILADFMKKADF